MTDLTNDEKREVLYELREKMDDCALLVRAVDDARLNATCLAAFEGREGGWLGEFERDLIEQAILALDDGDDDEPHDRPER